MNRTSLASIGVIFFSMLAQPVTANTLSWQTCFEGRAQKFECATLTVPLDYDTYFSHDNAEEYTGEWIGIPLIKLLANDPDKRIGSLVFNPGGPGNSGIDFVQRDAGSIYSDAVRDHFDYIGFDPRGIKRSEPLRCFSGFVEYLDILRLPEFPLTPLDYDKQLDTLESFGASCKNNASDIVHHMSTTDVAYDMEMLRIALNEEMLNFVGYSYGSFLGITYANLYPEKVGRFILDGVIDPQQWVTGYGDDGSKYSVSMRLKTDRASFDTLNEFFQQCDEAGPEECPIAGNSRETYQHIAHTLEQWQLEEFALSPYSYDQFIARSLSYLYNSANWKAFGDFLSLVQTQIDTASSLRDQFLFDPSSSFSAAMSFVLPQTIEGYPGVLCSDANTPTSREVWKTVMEEAENKSGYFAKLWAWNEAPCLNWPETKTQRYVGPYNAYTATGMLIMNTRYDPATPLSGALQIRNTHANSRLVIVEGAGHTTPFMSTCATTVADKYLITGELPQQDLVCQQDLPAFNSPNTSNSFSPTFNQRLTQRLSIMNFFR